MKANKNLENPTEEYVPALDEMVSAMPQQSGEITDDWGPEDWAEHHEGMDQSIRDRLTPPEKRPCFKCGRWVSHGLGEEEGEDPRCTRCEWQVCVCGACKCNYRGDK